VLSLVKFGARSSNGPILEAGMDEAPNTPGSFVATSTVRALVSVLCLVGLMGVAFSTWSTSVQLWYTGLISALTFMFVMVLIALLTSTQKPERIAVIEWTVLALSLILLAGWSASTLYAQPGYGTDEAAFTQLAAQMVLHGHNPYGANLISALAEFRVPIQYATYTLSGHIVDTYSYPSLPILFTIPFVSLTNGVQSAIIAEVVALGAGMVTAFLLLPRVWRSLAPLVFVGLPVLFGYSVSGVTAVLMATLLIVVANRWMTTGMSGHLGSGGVVRAVFLGLAISTQQWAWFVAPFVVLGIWRARQPDLGRRQSTRLAIQFAAISLATFMVVNAPFIIWGPGAWTKGILGPITQNAIPYGQGLVDASIFFRIGGGNLLFFTLAGVAIYLTILFAFVAWFPRFGRAAFVLPSLAFFFATRSLAEYFMTVVGVWVVSIATNENGQRSVATEPHRAQRKHPLMRRANVIWVSVLSLGSLLFCAAALADPAPLNMRIMGVTTNGQLEGVWRVMVQVTNKSSSALSPHFATNTVGQASTFWNVSKGPNVLAPHHTATYTVVAPNRGSMPGIATPFLLEAYTDNPNSISSTSLFTPDPYTTALNPSYVDSALRVGQTVVLTSELRNPFGALVHKAGVRIALGQVIYAQNSLIPSEASINSDPAGRTPVFARTDADGEATFRITDDQLQGQLLYFQSWIQTKGHFPDGYSEIVSVNWGRSGR
jgi:uncharacterized membrane protein